MVLDDKYLNLWYEDGNVLYNTQFIGRHSTGCQAFKKQDVCDYRLYPILKQDADMLLYNAVWDLVMFPNFNEFYESVDIPYSLIASDTKGKMDSWCRPYLLFPDDEPFLNYTEEEQKNKFLIAAFNRERATVPQYKVYYTIEWVSSDGSNDVLYREHHRYKDEEMPKMIINKKEFKKAIVNVLQSIDDIDVEGLGIWKKRLEMTLQMLETNANELHILHNAGLYDIAMLWKLYSQNGINSVLMRMTLRDFERELHRFAMMTVNVIDWKNGCIAADKVVSASMIEPEVIPSEPSYIDEILPKNWRNDLGAMASAFDWTSEERAMLDKAALQGSYGRGPFCDDWGHYANVLENMVRQRLRALARDEYEAKYRKKE